MRVMDFIMDFITRTQQLSWQVQAILFQLFHTYCSKSLVGVMTLLISNVAPEL